MKKVFTLVVIIILLSSSSWAEVIVLDSGMRVEGVIMNYEGNEILVKTADTDLTVPLKLIRKISPSTGKDRVNSNYVGRVTKKVEALNKVKRQKMEALVHRIRSKTIEFYVTTWCPYCKKMERYLKKIGAKYKKYDIEHNYMAEKKYKRLKGKGIPLLKIGKTIIRGYDTKAVWNALMR